jgi:hypothetical protein
LNDGLVQPHSQPRFRMRAGCVTSPTSAGGAVLFIPSNGEYVMLNDVSAVVIEALGSAQTLGSIADLVLSEYDAQRDVVLQDIESLVYELVGKSAAEEVHP